MEAATAKAGGRGAQRNIFKCCWNSKRLGEVDRNVGQEKREARNPVSGNVVVLGLGGSGKTTLAKHLRELTTPFLGEEARKKYLWDIQNQIMGDMQFLTEQASSFGFIWDTKEKRDLAEQCRGRKLVRTQLASLQKLWDCGTFREFANKREHLGIVPEDNLVYFFDNLERFSNDNYVPLFEEVMMLRETLTVSESGRQAEIWRMDVKDDEHINMYHRLNLVDVSSDNQHRQKWHKYFHDAIIIFYVVSMADYSHVNPRNGQNALREAFVTYRTLVNSKWFENGKVKIIVVLSKKDIFDAKISRDSFENYFPQGFAGVPAVTGADGYDREMVLDFIKRVFDRMAPAKVTERLEYHEINLAPMPDRSSTLGDNGGTAVDDNRFKSPAADVYKSLKAVVVHEGILKKTVKKMLAASLGVKAMGLKATIHPQTSIRRRASVIDALGSKKNKGQEVSNLWVISKHENAINNAKKTNEADAAAKIDQIEL